MEDFLKQELNAATIRLIGEGTGGYISNGRGYELDEKMRVFVKHNDDEKSKIMFDGEFLGLQKILETETLRTPQPHKIIAHPEGKGWIFVMEYIEMKPLRTQMKRLGEQLARLHLHNPSLETKSTKLKDQLTYVDRFGFESNTCCGFIPMPNEWVSDWMDFYARMRLQVQINLIEKKYGDRQVGEYWSMLQRTMSSMFTGITVKPSLLHGDLWSGNIAETINEPVVYDPASFYGHHEFDLAITNMFGGFTRQFYDGYHSLIPQSPGFESRQKLYLLFHYLNHWNHFGSSYRHKSLEIMKELVKK